MAGGGGGGRSAGRSSSHDIGLDQPAPAPGDDSGEGGDLGHIQSAYCKGQAEVVTAAHNRCNEFIQREIQHLVEEVEVITVEHESSMQMIWEHEMIRDIYAHGRSSLGAGGSGMGSTRRGATQSAKGSNPVSENPRRKAGKEAPGEENPKGSRMQTRKTRMRQLAGWKECQVRATNVQINV